MVVDLNLGSLVEPLTGRRWPPAEIRHRWLARALDLEAAGLTPGDRVFLLYGNTPEFFVDLLAIWSLGGCASPVDPRLTPFEIDTVARFAAPRFAVVESRQDQAIEHALDTAGVQVLHPPSDRPVSSPASRAVRSWPEVALDQDALILFTSGTTGQPKGVVHTHRSLRARWQGLRDALGLESFARTLCLLPTHFGHGLICNALFPWLSGQDLYVMPPFKPAHLMALGAILDDHAITFMSSVPTLWRLALRTSAPPARGSLRRVHCGSAPLSAALWSDVQRWTGTEHVLNTYGITETGSWLAGTSVSNFVPEDGLVGVPWGGIVRILPDTDPIAAFAAGGAPRAGEPGHVWVNTPALMRGYLGRDDLTREAVTHGWFLTGDIGLIDDRGWLYLKGREREEINKGGMKVHPADIDAVAERFPAVRDVCTFACEDPLLGENIAIAVVVDPSDAGTLRALAGWCHQHLARHQWPTRWYVVAEIPRTSRGKVNRRTVGERCATMARVDPADLRSEVTPPAPRS